jgi:hypothetical protein
MKHREYTWGDTKLFPDAIKNTYKQVSHLSVPCPFENGVFAKCQQFIQGQWLVLLLLLSTPVPFTFIAESPQVHIPFLLPAILSGEKNLRDQWSTKDAWTYYHSHPKNHRQSGVRRQRPVTMQLISSWHFFVLFANFLITLSSCFHTCHFTNCSLLHTVLHKRKYNWVT